MYVFAGRVALFHVVEEEEDGGGGGGSDDDDDDDDDCGGGKQNSVCLLLCDNTHAVFCNSENVSPWKPPLRKWEERCCQTANRQDIQHWKVL